MHSEASRDDTILVHGGRRHLWIALRVSNQADTKTVEVEWMMSAAGLAARGPSHKCGPILREDFGKEAILYFRHEHRSTSHKARLMPRQKPCRQVYFVLSSQLLNGFVSIRRNMQSKSNLLNM